MHNNTNNAIILPCGAVLIDNKNLVMIRIAGSDDALTRQAFCNYATKYNFKHIDLVK